MAAPKAGARLHGGTQLHTAPHSRHAAAAPQPASQPGGRAPSLAPSRGAPVPMGQQR
eukprot:CAMPEP_0202897676 /NCGR_PEP_ID=MMETSP1392-20130828/6380_1 /ASSEMBLY_ACC=CAM_ASM_000868 /TAXON_ID=225041 /ORGANISM="Chlamydomonas chlamydogama, Strain SAG 11-48b" /LENGTH=56 /DNA_ID=CAMNT_0049583373 /DNA_START=999 /DNA_END=1166 /DNA_ORIENTATION=+